MERMTPENSLPRVNGGVWRDLLFWCLPRAWWRLIEDSEPEVGVCLVLCGFRGLGSKECEIMVE